MRVCPLFWPYRSVWQNGWYDVLQAIDTSKLVSRRTVTTTMPTKCKLLLEGGDHGHVTHFLNLGPLLFLEWVKTDTAVLQRRWTVTTKYKLAPWWDVVGITWRTFKLGTHPIDGTDEETLPVWYVWWIVARTNRKMNCPLCGRGTGMFSCR